MLKTSKLKRIRQINIRYYAIAFFIAWTLFSLGSLYLNFHHAKSKTLEIVKYEAQMALERDLLYRRWSAGFGGVYVPVSNTISPNPYLADPKRDIRDETGMVYTKINPAFMTRMVHEMALLTNGVKGHITSLNPIRPENRPDEWETSALKNFEKGVLKESGIVQMGDGAYLRLMKPILTEPQCMACHAKQGYNVGDVRGGISVSVPLNRLKQLEIKQIKIFSLTYGLIWGIGMLGGGLGFVILNRQLTKNRKAQKKLQQQEKLTGVIEMAGAVSHELNQPLQAILTAAEILETFPPGDDKKFRNVCYLLIVNANRMGIITEKLMHITTYKTKKYLKKQIIDINEASK